MGATEVRDLIDVTQAKDLRERLHLCSRQKTREACALSQALAKELAFPLTKLHQFFGPYPLFRQGSDQHTDLHKQLYLAHQHVKDLYWQLAQFVVTELIEEPCHIQTIPTYRFGFPDNRWVGNFHRDSDFGHSAYELNCILAFTPMLNTAALQVEDAPGSNSFSPLNLQASEIVMFNHIDRKHGCVVNEEAATAVSIDFRFVPIRFAHLAFHAPLQSINTHLSMMPGGYFSADPLEIR